MSKVDFASLAVGDTVQQLVLPPISRTTLALFGGASGDHNPIHVDIDFARASGMPDVFAHGMLVMAYLGRTLTNWMPQTVLRNFKVRFTAITNVGDELVCTARVAEKFEEDERKLVRLDLAVADQTNAVKIAGEAIVVIA